MTSRHIYADLLWLIADGNAQLQWLDDSTNTWYDQANTTTLREIAGELYPLTRYRVKPVTIRIGKFDVPAPLRTTPNDRTPVHMPWAPAADKKVYSFDFNIGSEAHSMWLKRGLIHTDKAAAELHYDALVSFTSTEQA